MHALSTAALLISAVGLPSLVSAVSIDCKKIVADETTFNINPLAGEHSVSHTRDSGVEGHTTNNTYTFNLCAPLRLSRDSKVEAGCRHGSYACAFERNYDKDTKELPAPNAVWSIAGNYEVSHGQALDPATSRLKPDGEDNDDSDGIRIEYKGGPPRDKGEYYQKMIVDLICPRDTKNSKGKNKDDDKIKVRSFQRRDEDDDGDDDEDGKDKDEEKERLDLEKGLEWKSYRPRPGSDRDKQKMYETLHLKWTTRWACEGQNAAAAQGGSHWGFFTWFIIVFFLAVAAYLVFGSWLNYTRHGARGWDLLPHGDTIRDVPYILRDWGRKVVSTVQGGGSRGGYSAV